MATVKPIAIFLPQFHPIRENDDWWGKGFTEWTNVTKTKPRFEGHYQPHLPADLGFYDLRLEESRIEQETLAKEYGIEGFCYYHYWFNGKWMLDEPLKRKLANPKEDLPFMLCWANENWTRRWDGLEQEVLIKQDYSLEDDKLHFYELLPYFRDPRYIKVNEKPVFIIYRTELFPDIKKTADLWQKLARENGLNGLYLIRVESFSKGLNPLSIGLDASMLFQPDWANLPSRYWGTLADRIFHKLNIKSSPFSANRVYDYAEVVWKAINLQAPSYKYFPSLTPMWDNCARRKEGALIFRNSTPASFGKWYKHIVNNFKPHSKEENFIFINAWNEWAEGNHLEPCQQWGRQYLEAIKLVMRNA